MARGKKSEQDEVLRQELLLADRFDSDDIEDDSPAGKVAALVDDAGNFGSWLAGDGQEIKITVTRPSTAHRGTEEFVMRAMSSDYTPDELLGHLQTHYGGGEYRIKGYFQGKLAFNQKHVIASLAAKPAEKLPEIAGGNDTAVIIRQMQLQMLESQINAQRQQAEMMTSMMHGLSGMMKPQPAADPLDQMKMMVGMFSAAREMFKPSEGAGAGGMEMIKMAMEFAKELGGGGGSDKETNANDVLMSLLNVAGKTLPEILAQQKGKPALPRSPAQMGKPPQRIESNPVPLLSNHTPIAVTPAEKPKPGQLHAAALQVDMLRATGVSPGDAAGMISDSVDDATWNKLEGFFRRPDWLTLLDTAVPAVNSPDGHAWWSNIRQTILNFDDNLTSEPETAKTGQTEPETPNGEANAIP